MTRKSLVPTGAVLALALGLLLTADSRPVQGQEEGSEMACRDCHEEQVKTFEKSPHRPGALPKTEKSSERQVCESCHQDATKHLEEGGGKGTIFVPAGRAGTDTCLSCHRFTPEHSSFGTGAHINAKVGCADCHQVHGEERSTEPLLKKDTTALCASCHTSEAASFRKPFAHRLSKSGLDCASCHDPHAGAGTKNLRVDAAGDNACVSCHGEKKGPFVFTHVTGVTGDCTSCHEPHGSSNPKRLRRANVAQLCLECHSRLDSSSLGSQPPSSHDLRHPRWQNCTTCHVAIHGSNSSPQLLK